MPPIVPGASDPAYHHAGLLAFLGLLDAASHVNDAGCLRLRCCGRPEWRCDGVRQGGPWLVGGLVESVAAKLENPKVFQLKSWLS
jgi:hypothetical protein